MTEPNIITHGKKGNGWLPLTDLQFCEGVRDAINRDPNRRALVKKKSNCCRVVDFSRPIRVAGHKTTAYHGTIIGWEPMVNVVSPSGND